MWVAKVIALMKPASKGLVACLEANVMALRITSSFLYRATHLLALVPFTCLRLVANLGAAERLSLLKFFGCHQLFLQFWWIVDRVARTL